MVRRLETLLILVLMLACSVLLTICCEEGASTGPVVNNSGDNNAFNFSDDSNGQSSATSPRLCERQGHTTRGGLGMRHFLLTCHS
jgi:hypothetical protein